MLMKLKRNDSTPICGKKTFRFLSRMTRSKSSPYQRMDLDGKEMRNKKLEERKAEDLTKGKENIKTATPKEVKEKKSKKKNHQSSSYQRIVLNGKQNRNKKLEEEKAKVLTKGKGNIKTVTTKEVKGKESKNGGWKKVGQICLTTCRYIGMGAAHMSPATVYASPDYHVDPKVWNKSFSHSYKPKVPPPVPHWTSTMMYSAW